jgi:hypothetical protein
MKEGSIREGRGGGGGIYKGIGSNLLAGNGGGGRGGLEKISGGRRSGG